MAYNPYNFSGLLSPQRTEPMRGQSFMGQPMQMPAPSPATMQLQQGMQQQPQGLFGRVGSGVSSAARGLGGAFTGEGSSARLSALGASLLQGPSRTPIGFGTSLAQGLLAGNQAVAAEQERKFKRGLLEQEMDYKTKSLQSKSSKDTLYNITQIGPDGEPFTFTVNQDGASKYYNDRNSTVTKVGAGSETGSTPTVLTNAAQKIESMGGDLSKDTVVNDDGSVNVIKGSRTQQELKLKDDKLKLSKEEFAQKVKQVEIENSFKERKIALDEGRAVQDDTKAKLDFEIANYEFKKNQKIDEKKELSQWKTVSGTARKIRNLREQIEGFGAENVLGPMSYFKDIPFFGPSQPAGQVALSFKALQAQLTKSAMDDFRELSKAGATGFGALNQKELEVLESYVVALNQAGNPKQQLEALDNLQNVYDSLAYGVIVNGKYEDYSPIKHENGLYEGSIIPAIKENERLIGVPTAADIPTLKGATFLNRNKNGGFVFKLSNDKMVVVGD